MLYSKTLPTRYYTEHKEHVETQTNKVRVFDSPYAYCNYYYNMLRTPFLICNTEKKNELDTTRKEYAEGLNKLVENMQEYVETVKPENLSEYNKKLEKLKNCQNTLETDPLSVEKLKVDLDFLVEEEEFDEAAVLKKYIECVQHHNDTSISDQNEGSSFCVGGNGTKQPTKKLSTRTKKRSEDVVDDLKSPATEVKQALMYILPDKFTDIIWTMAQGHSGNQINESYQNYINSLFQTNFEKDRVRLKNLHKSTLNNPTYFFLEALGKSGLSCMIPGREHTCLAISATANSMHEPAPFEAIKLISKDFDENNWTRWGVAHGTTQKDCLTGVSSESPKNICVLYDENTPDHGFVEMTRRMKTQMCDEINDQKFDYMFMHGCIHRQYLKNAEGKVGPSWNSIQHEKWLNCLQLAEMATAVEKLPVGGNLCVKVRIMELETTHVPVAAVAKLFKLCEIIAVTGQHSHYGLVMFCDKSDEKETVLKKLSEDLCNCASGTCPPLLELLKSGVDLKVLQRCDEIGSEIRRYSDVTYLVFFDLVRRIQENRKVTWGEINKAVSETPLYQNFITRFHDKFQWIATFDELKRQVSDQNNITKQILRIMGSDF